MTTYTVTRVERGVSKMSRGKTEWIEPTTYAQIRDESGQIIQTVRLNATVFCCPEPLGTGEGREATDEQILLAVMNDESVFAPDQS